jgi:hypothetical protein
MLTQSNKMFHRLGMLCLVTIMYRCAMLAHLITLNCTGIAEDMATATLTKTNLNLPSATKIQFHIMDILKSCTMSNTIQLTVLQRDITLCMKLQ